MRYHSTAGLTRAQMTELIARCWQVHSGRQPGDLGRYAFVMPFGKAVSMVLIMARHNLAQQLTGGLFGVSQATVSRVWRHLLPIIGQVTALDRSRLADALHRGLVLLDGTPVPTGDRTGTGTTNYNKKHHKQALGLQVAAFRDGTLADVSSPVRGSRHDSRALEEVGWAEQITQARRSRPADCCHRGHRLHQAHPSHAPEEAPRWSPDQPGQGVEPPDLLDTSPGRAHDRAAEAVENPVDRLPRLSGRTTKRDPHGYQPGVLPPGHLNNALRNWRAGVWLRADVDKLGPLVRLEPLVPEFGHRPVQGLGVTAVIRFGFVLQ